MHTYIHFTLINQLFLCKKFNLCIFLFFWLHLAACGILVPWPGTELAPPAVEAWRKWKPGKRKFNTVLIWMLWIMPGYYCLGIMLGIMSGWLVWVNKQIARVMGEERSCFVPLAVPICPHIGCLSFSVHSPWFLPPHLVPRRQKPLLFPGSVGWQVTGIQKKGQDCSLESREGSHRDRHSLAPECARCDFQTLFRTHRSPVMEASTFLFSRWGNWVCSGTTHNSAQIALSLSFFSWFLRDLCDPQLAAHRAAFHCNR